MKVANRKERMMPKKNPPWKDRPLRAFVSRGVLTIEIGVDTLEFAALRSDYAWELVGKENHTVDPATVFRIDDKREFAHDVARELNREAEDGSTPITELLDKACQRAIEEGSIAFVDTRDPG